MWPLSLILFVMCNFFASIEWWQQGGGGAVQLQSSVRGYLSNHTYIFVDYNRHSPRTYASGRPEADTNIVISAIATVLLFFSR